MSISWWKLLWGVYILVVGVVSSRSTLLCLSLTRGLASGPAARQLCLSCGITVITSLWKMWYAPDRPLAARFHCLGWMVRSSLVRGLWVPSLYFENKYNARSTCWEHCMSLASQRHLQGAKDLQTHKKFIKVLHYLTRTFVSLFCAYLMVCAMWNGCLVWVCLRPLTTAAQRSQAEVLLHQSLP